MQYKIEPYAQDEGFRPYQLTLTVETEAEAKIVHDLIACKIAYGSSFIGDVFRAIRCPTPACSGDVPLKDQVNHHTL